MTGDHGGNQGHGGKTRAVTDKVLEAQTKIKGICQ